MISRRSGGLAAALWVSLVVAAPAGVRAATQAIRSDPVVVESGNLAGTQLASGVRAYLGVPFAAPPVRELRWRPPQSLTPWQGTYHADRPAPECIQTLRAHDINHYFGEEATSEDCLYLNIWAPPHDAAAPPAPVVVWIYGGGFTIGSASMANYSGERLAMKGAVYVALAYRVGALGFLAHPELSAESPRHVSGNYGFLDQIAAMQWIQRNIARFGGDPGNVTIMGQSAGSASVCILQASPLSRGLFHQAVGMSGGALGANMGRARPMSTAEQWGHELQVLLKAPSMEALRHLPADRILAVQGTTGRYGPLVDGWLLPEDPNAIFAAGKQNDVPILVGFTRDEGFDAFNQVKTLSDYREQAQRWREHTADLLRMYPAKSDAEARRAALDIARDATLGLQMRTWARAQTSSGKAPAYMYLFSRVHPYAPGVKFSDHDAATIGAYHTGDVPYWLQTLDSLNLFRTTRNWTQYDRELATRMSDVIVSFARTGKPALSGIEWPVYRSDDERVVELGDSVRVIALPNSKKIDFLAAHPPREVVVGEGGRPAIATRRKRRGFKTSMRVVFRFPVATAMLIAVLFAYAIALGDTPSAMGDPAVGTKPVLEDRYPERRVAFPDGVMGLPDLTYSTVSGFRPLTLDLYLPGRQTSGGAPVIVYVHGGGWTSGHTRHSGAFENWPGVLASLSSRGYVVASINYRLSAEAPSPAAEQDVKSAVRWLRANASRFGIDRQHIGIWGGSAGGQLAALAGTGCGVQALEPPAADSKTAVESDCVQGVVAWYGVFDFTPLAKNVAAPPNVARYLGCGRSACSDQKIALASAIRYVDRGDPPFLLIHGALDKTVAVSQSENFHAALQASAVKSQLIVFPDVDHSFIGSTPELTRSARLRALQATIDFFDATLRPAH